MPDAHSSSTHNRQLANSNATLNFVLGGRLKPWMDTPPQHTPLAASTVQRGTTVARPAPTTTRPVGRPRKRVPANVAPSQATQATQSPIPKGAVPLAREHALPGPLQTPPALPAAANVASRTHPISRPDTGAHIPSTHAPVVQDQTQHKNGDGQHGVVLPHYWGRHTARVNKPSTFPETEAPAVSTSYTVNHRHKPRPDDIVSLGSASISGPQPTSMATVSRMQLPTPPLSAPVLSEAQAAAWTNNAEPRMARVPALIRPTTAAAARASSERGRRRTLSGADREPLPNKQRRLDDTLQEYTQGLGCQACRENDRECNGRMPCLDCVTWGSACQYETSDEQQMPAAVYPQSPAERLRSASISQAPFDAQRSGDATRATGQEQEAPTATASSTPLPPPPPQGGQERLAAESITEGPTVAATDHQTSPIQAPALPFMYSEDAFMSVFPSASVPQKLPAQSVLSTHPGIQRHNHHVPTGNVLPALRSAPLHKLFEPSQCLAFIDTLVFPHGRAGAPRQVSGTEFARLAALQEAVLRGDLEFLLIHQLFCISTYDPQGLPDNLKRRPDVVCCFATLDRLFRSNKELTPAILGFCATFPAPFTDVMRLTPMVYLSRREQLDVFFQKTSASWKSFSSDVFKRGHPPLVYEMVEVLGTSSPMMQRLMFLALTRYMLQVEDSHWLQKADRLFQRNQADWHRFMTRKPRYPLKRDKLDMYHSWFVTRYDNLRQMQERFRAGDQGLADISDGSEDSPLRDLENTPINLLLEAADYRSPAGDCQAADLAPLTPGVAGPRQSAAGHITLNASQLQQHPQTLQTATYNPFQSQSSRLPLHKPLQYVQGSLLPPRATLAAQQIAPNPNIVALHQVNLRRPLLQMIGLPSDISPKDIFQQVHSFVLPPLYFKQGAGFSLQYSFAITETAFRRIPKEATDDRLDHTIRFLYPVSLQYRVRGCHRKAFSSPTAISQRWCVTETSWHPNVYIKFNDNYLELERKLHHGKDLPIDVTPLVQNGTNKLEISMNVQEGDMTPYDHMFAIELITLSSAAFIRRHLTAEKRIAATTSLDRIKKHLAGQSSSGSADNDEILMVSSNLTIPLIEPFSNSKICEIPVRGKYCLHPECFDLDTFLATRPAYYKAPNLLPAISADIQKLLNDTPGVPGLNPERDKLYALQRPEGPSAVDCWMCPICRADARPQNLVIDGFLVEVRKVLEKQGRLGTRAIVVEADGRWYPKVDKAEEGSSETEARDTTALEPLDTDAAVHGKRKSSVRNTPTPVVIDLFDSDGEAG